MDRVGDNMGATIPVLERASEYFGNTINISVDSAPSGYKHKLTYKFKNETGTIATNVESHYNWRIPNSLMNEIPNSTEGTCYIYCETFVNGKSIGKKYKTFKAKVFPDIAPHITNVELSEARPEVIEAFQSGYVEGESKLNIQVDASGTYSSTIKKYYTTVSGKKYSSTSSTFQTGYLENPGDVHFDVHVEDSRGRTTTKRVFINVKHYRRPYFSATSSERCNSDGTINDEGNCIKVRTTAYIDPLSVHRGTFTIQYKKATETEWQTAPLGEKTIDGAKETYTTIIVGTAADESYDFKATVKDSMHSHSLEFKSGKIALSLLANGKGAKFFGEADQEGFFVKDVQFPPVLLRANIDAVHVDAGDNYTTLCEVPVSRGTYLATGYMKYRTAYDANKLMRLGTESGSWGVAERSVGNSSGNTTICGIVTATTSDKIQLQARHSADGAHTAENCELKVIRIG